MNTGFKIEDQTLINKELIFSKDFTNAMIFGRTGSGKTTGAILANIKDRIKNDYGMLIYDFKGNLHLQAKHLANLENKLDKVIEIGKPWSSKINLINYLSSNDITQSIVKSKSNDEYWNIASKNLFYSVYNIIKSFNTIKDIYKKADDYFIHYPKEVGELSFENIFNKVSDISNINKFYLDTKHNFEYLKKVVRNDVCNSTRASIYNEIISTLEKNFEIIKIYEKVDLNDNSGKYAVVTHLASLISNIASEAFLNNNEIDIIKELRAGKIIVFDVSNLNTLALELINKSIYKRLQKATYETMKPVSLFVDEAQKILNGNYLPEVDVCREFRFEYIFATQDEVLLENRLGKSKFDELFCNISNQYTLNTNKDNHLKKFEVLNLSNNRTFFIEPILINKKDLIKTEHRYLLDNEILNMIDYKSTKEFIIKYDEKLMEEYKLTIETIDEEIIEVDYIGKPSIKEVQRKKASELERLRFKHPRTKSIHSKVEDLEDEVSALKQILANMIMKEEQKSKDKNCAKMDLPEAEELDGLF